MNGVRDFRIEKSHQYENGLVLRCPLTESLVFSTGPMSTVKRAFKAVDRYARQRSVRVMDFTKPELRAGLAPMDGIDL